MLSSWRTGWDEYYAMSIVGEKKGASERENVKKVGTRKVKGKIKVQKQTENAKATENKGKKRAIRTNIGGS
jgi:hypothetical protein